MKLALNRKLPPCWLAVIVLEGALQTAGLKTHWQSYQAKKPVDLIAD